MSLNILSCKIKKRGLIKRSVDSRKIAMESFTMLEGLKTLLYYGASLSRLNQIWASFATDLLNEIKENKSLIQK